MCFNPLQAELNPICHLLALLGGATIVVVSRLRVKFQFGGGGHASWQSLANVGDVCCENGGRISQQYSFVYCIFKDIKLVKTRVPCAVTRNCSHLA